MAKYFDKEKSERKASVAYIYNHPPGYPDRANAGCGVGSSMYNGDKLRTVWLWHRPDFANSVKAACLAVYIINGDGKIVSETFKDLNTINARFDVIRAEVAKIPARKAKEKAAAELRATRVNPPHVIRYLAAAEAMKAEAGIVEHIVSDKRGHARVDEKIIRAPEGRTIKQLRVVAHECGHVACGHGSDCNKTRHVKEFEAEKYAYEALRRHGIKVPRALVQSSKMAIAHQIKMAGPKAKIDPKVLTYVGAENRSYLKAYRA